MIMGHFSFRQKSLSSGLSISAGLNLSPEHCFMSETQNPFILLLSYVGPWAHGSRWCHPHSKKQKQKKYKEPGERMQVSYLLEKVL